MVISHLQKYYGVYLLILAFIFLILWFPNRANNRYAISGIGDNVAIWILDTKTGHIWMNYKTLVFDCGTIQKPIFECKNKTLSKYDLSDIGGTLVEDSNW